jgi:hypothetical protein
MGSPIKSLISDTALVVGALALVAVLAIGIVAEWF